MSAVSLLDQTRDFLARQHGHYIGGQRHANSENAYLEVVNPATEEVIARVAAAGASDVDAAVRSAQSGFASWQEVLPAQKERVLNALADKMADNRDLLAQLETLQSGKTINLSRAFEVDQAVGFLRYYAGWAQRITGQTIQPSIPATGQERYTAFTRREPLGVVVGIVPWNFSIMTAVWKLASALVTGNSIVIKPSEYTPLTMLKLAELAHEAGLPAGALNVVTGDGQVGQQLLTHEGTSKISFTGSVATGSKVGAAAMEASLTRVTLELGGKNPMGVLPDADMDKVADGMIEAGFLYTGQICAEAEKFFVPRSRLDELGDKLVARLKQFKIGSPLDTETDFGPVANMDHYRKLQGIFQQIADNGNTVLHGGYSLAGTGCYVAPTALLAHSIDDPLIREETFGPIATLLPYDDEDELLAYMNHGPYGLAASLWTESLSTAMRLIPQVQAGMVWVNMHTVLDPAVPFGGVKSSGLGREFGEAFIDDFTELKSVMIRY